MGRGRLRAAMLQCCIDGERTALGGRKSSRPSESGRPPAAAPTTLRLYGGASIRWGRRQPRVAVDGEASAYGGRDRDLDVLHLRGGHLPLILRVVHHPHEPSLGRGDKATHACQQEKGTG
jgi:hypothetical protein